MALNGAPSDDLLGLDDIDFQNWAADDGWTLFTYPYMDSSSKEVAEFLMPYTDQALPVLPEPVLIAEPIPVDIKVEKEESPEALEQQEKPMVRKAREKHRREVQIPTLKDDIKQLEHEIEQLVDGDDSFAHIKDPKERRRSKNAQSATLSRRRKSLAAAKSELEIQTLKEEKAELAKQNLDLYKDNNELAKANMALINVNQELERENAQLKAQLAQMQHHALTEDFGVNVTTMLIRYTSPVSSPRKSQHIEKRDSASCDTLLKRSI